MAKTTKKESTAKKSTDTDLKKTSRISRQQKILFGSILVLFSISLFLAFVSFYIYGQYDQSAVDKLTDRDVTVENWLGKFGAFLSDVFVYRGFGLASFLFVRLFFLTGAYLVLNLPLSKLKNTWFWDLFALIVISVS